jgi:hypothetical protein
MPPVIGAKNIQVRVVPSGSHIQRWQQRQSQALTREALDRILACAPQKGDLDLDKLRQDLESARALYLTGKGFRKGKTQLRDKIESLARRVRRVEKLLADEQVWKEIAWHQLPREQDTRELVVLLRTAVERRLSYRPPAEPAWATEWAAQFITELGLGERSAFEWLVGQHLALLYEEHFGRRRGRSRGADGLSGPYMRFAKQVLIELGITKNGKAYSDESFSKALSAPRPDRGRRK